MFPHFVYLTLGFMEFGYTDVMHLQHRKECDSPIIVHWIYLLIRVHYVDFEQIRLSKTFLYLF